MESKNKIERVRGLGRRTREAIAKWNQKNKIERVRGLGRRTREAIAKWNQPKRLETFLLIESKNCSSAS